MDGQQPIVSSVISSAYSSNESDDNSESDNENNNRHSFADREVILTRSSPLSYIEADDEDPHINPSVSLTHWAADEGTGLSNQVGNVNFYELHRNSFSPQPSTSTDYVESQISSMDPNMSSTACYSPIYSISTSPGTHYSRMNSPIPGQCLSHPVSPLGASCHSLHSTELSESPHASLNHSYGSRRRPHTNSPVPGSSGLQNNSASSNNLARCSTNFPTVHSPSDETHLPMQSPVTPNDNYLVSSSTSCIESGQNPHLETNDDDVSESHSSQNGDLTSNFESAVDSTSELSIQPDESHQDEIAPIGGVESSCNNEIAVSMSEPEMDDITTSGQELNEDEMQELLHNSLPLKNDSPPLYSRISPKLKFSLVRKIQSELLQKNSSTEKSDKDAPVKSSVGKSDDEIVNHYNKNCSYKDLSSPELKASLYHSNSILSEQLSSDSNSSNEKNDQFCSASELTYGQPTNGNNVDIQAYDSSCDNIPQASSSGINTAIRNDFPELKENSENEDIVCFQESTDCEPLAKRIRIKCHETSFSESKNAICGVGISVDETENENTPEDNKDFWCEDCKTYYVKSCHIHEVQTIMDKPVLSRAWATLPANYLDIQKVGVKDNGNPEYGVFAKRLIKKRTKFGPMEGLINKNSQPSSSETILCFSLSINDESKEFYHLDTSSEVTSNWMRFVRPAHSYSEQNLCLIETVKGLFFISTKNIRPQQELRVHYCSSYAEKRGLTMLKLTEDDDLTNDLDDSDQNFNCDLKLSQDSPDSDQAKDSDSGKSMESMDDSMTTFTCLLANSGTTASCLFDCDSGIQDESSSEASSPNRATTHWICALCNLIFSNLSVLNLHMLGHENNGDKEENIIGATCQMSEVDELSSWHLPDRNKDDHILLVNAFNCPECGRSFPGKKELFDHVTSHGKMLSLGEDVSLGVAKIKDESVKTSSNKRYKCETCYKGFASLDGLKKHSLVHGLEENKPLKCDICQKRFVNNSALSCHLKIHSEEKKMYECPICCSVFDMISKLKVHVSIHCEDGTFRCPRCDKVFDSYCRIRKHVRSFHGNRRFPCCYCEKVFFQSDKLKNHLLRHSDHREFLCANCGKQFKRKDKLKEHMKKLHSAERELRQTMDDNSRDRKFIPKVSPTDYHRFIYKCHSCLLGFKRRGMLVNHLAKRHPNIRPDSVPELNLPILKTTRDYFCQYCDKVYKSSSKRKAHILKNHPGADLPLSNRKLKSQLDEELGHPNPSFSQTVGSITTHPHNCQWCHKQYASRAKLLQHQRKKHNDLLPQTQQTPRGKPLPVLIDDDDSLNMMTSPMKVDIPSEDSSGSYSVTIGDVDPSHMSVLSAYTGNGSHEVMDYEDGIILASGLKDSSKLNGCSRVSSLFIHREDLEGGIPLSNIVGQAGVLTESDLLTQAMSELSPNLDYKSITVDLNATEQIFKVSAVAPLHQTSSSVILQNTHVSNHMATSELLLKSSPSSPLHHNSSPSDNDVDSLPVIISGPRIIKLDSDHPDTVLTEEIDDSIYQSHLRQILTDGTYPQFTQLSDIQNHTDSSHVLHLARPPSSIVSYNSS